MEPADQQLAILGRGVGQIVEERELRARLAEGRPLRIKVGFDPTAPDLHLGHSVVMRKMRQWQDLGHEVVFLVGDFTAMIGDPTGRSAARPPLTREQVVANAETYTRQAFKVLDRARTRIEWNSSWLAQMSLADVIRLAARATVARVIEREDFATRLREGRPIAMHELLYPLLQAYDSVALRADVELGGSDQLFNLLIGRDLMREHGLRPQIVMTLPLLEGLDGVQKMSKSAGNYIGVDEPAREIFGKTMSVPDAIMWRYHELLSARPADEVARLRADVDAGRAHPRQVKADLAYELAARFSSEAEAQAARAEFDRMFSGGRAAPDAIEERTLAAPAGAGALKLVQVLRDCGLCRSNGEARSLIAQGGVEVDGVRVGDDQAELRAGASYTLRAGKRRWCKVTIHT